MGLLQRIVKNDSTKLDPPEIYNGRVFIVSLVVSHRTRKQHSRCPFAQLTLLEGLFGSSAVRHGHGHHGWGIDNGYIQAVSLK